MLKGVVFLGNPGREYAFTRHNLAWLVAERLSFADKLSWIRKFKGSYAGCTIAGAKRWLLKPETFMNRCGESVQPFLQFFKFTPAELLVVHDDLELDFTAVSFKKGGGLAGHNGLRSLAGRLDSSDFYRFRLGIGRPRSGSPANYVLSRFSVEEEIVLTDYLIKAALLLEEGLQAEQLIIDRKFVMVQPL